jgi:imidazolonepropionase-like amidohydrolase
LVQESRKFGRSVAAHAHGEEGILRALHAGVQTNEHGTFLHRSPEAISYMAEHSIILVPTLKVGWDIILAKDADIPEWIMENNNALQGDAELSLRLAHKAGVPI